jgi:ethanolamine utilization protein EutN
MYFGRVVGSVWATIKNPNMEGLRMLVIQPLTPELANTGKPLICTDYTGAGPGDLIYWVRGREASYALLPKEPATDTTVVAIVDSVHLKSSVAPESRPAAAPEPRAAAAAEPRPAAALEPPPAAAPESRPAAVPPPAKGRKPSRKANSC